jgi:hypothetical protein
MAHKISTLKSYFDFSSTNCASPLILSSYLDSAKKERGILLFFSCLVLVKSQQVWGGVGFGLRL